MNTAKQIGAIFRQITSGKIDPLAGNRLIDAIYPRGLSKAAQKQFIRSVIREALRCTSQ